MEEANPFLALFNSQEEASLSELRTANQIKDLCSLLTRIFLFTGTSHEDQEPVFVSTLPRYVVHLPQLSRDEDGRGHNGNLSLENYSQGLAERILLMSSDLEVLDLQVGVDRQLLLGRDHAMEPSAMKYLAECYSRATNEGNSSGRRNQSGSEDYVFSADKHRIIQQCQKEIVDRASIVIRTDNAKGVLQSSLSSCQFIQLVKSALCPGASIPVQFFYDIANCQSDSIEALKSIFDVLLEDLYLSHPMVELSTPGLDNALNMIELFASQSVLCKVLTSFKHWLPGNVKTGAAFEAQTILGKFLSPTCMAKSPRSPSTYFPMDRRLYQSEVEETTVSVRYQLEHYTTRLWKIFEAILRASPETKQALVTWLVMCFESNSDRGKMAAALNRAQLPLLNQASDGFFVNLSWIMLRLSFPFMVSEQAGSVRAARVKAIDVSYCAYNASASDAGVPIIDFSKDSKLVPLMEENEGPLHIPLNLPFNFITHCFFLTHKCLMLGISLVLSKYQSIHRYLSHLHHMIGLPDDLEAPPGSPLWFFRNSSSQVLAIKAHALHPALIELSVSFYATTAEWMVQQVIAEEEATATIPEKPPPFIRVIPECLVENMSSIVMALRQMDSQLTLLPHHVHSFLSFCTIYMRSSSYIRNPHIRAKLAQLIRFIIHRGETSDPNLYIDMRKDLFSNHPMARNHLMAALLSIFVDIEHTGESMEFEDKFAYRLPMYEIIEFLWDIPAYRASIEKLSDEVVTDSGMTETTPVFLRFINMIINDAIVQLDEGLENLAAIKELEDLQNSDEWGTFSAERKKEHEEKLKEAVMYATNRNQLGGKTVHILKIITNDVRKPFVIAGIVDRMAAMLNYVLGHLVGKGSKNFKVKDAEKYHFSPRTLVRSIVTIYLNLGHEACFCEALPRDGRSFSMDLFAQTERVLWIVSESPESVIGEWRELSIMVKECSEKLFYKETLFENAPEEFLDPFTQELMDDPVVLPSSGHTVDRSSILRHLLSDQQDPFNRAPLTPDMLQTNHGLQERIIKWKAGKMASSE